MRARLYLIASTSILLSACVDKTTELGMDEARQAEHFCAEFRDRRIARLSFCLGAAESFWEQALGIDSCAHKIEQILRSQIDFNEVAAIDCIGKEEGASCMLEAAESCAEVFRGRLSDGDVCESGQCAPGHYCEVDEKTPCSGVCKPAAAEGAPCNPTVSGSCSGTMKCSRFLAASNATICRLPPRIGEPCDDFLSCSDTTESFCDFSGACAPRKNLNEKCVNEFNECQSGMICSGALENRHCQPWKKVGEECTLEFRECAPFYSYCSTSGLCTSSSFAGGPCNTQIADYFPCIDSYCDLTMQICQQKKKAGSPCEQSLECEADRCEEFRCAERTTCKLN